MCPACLSTVTLAVVGVTSTGGLAALLARRLRLKKRPRKGPRPREDAAMHGARPEPARGD
jgi:hypothetical protein